MKNKTIDKEVQLNIKFTEEEFKIIPILKKKYSVNISQFVKNCLLNKLEIEKKLEENK